MLKVTLGERGRSALRLLCLGAHSDDIEIGCGGTILKLLEEYPQTEVRWVVLGATGERVREARESAELFLADAGRKEVIIKEFRDGFFPYAGSEIKEVFEKLKRGYTPNLIFTHHREDLHQDHRVVSELTWNTFRDHLILEYEIVKYDGDMGRPNVFAHLTRSVCDRKIRNILQCFESQREKQWFTEDTFWGILRLRGLESNAPERYAEAYYGRKIAY